ncbi:MAG: endonuclease MutS2, partial [Erysipelotrichaceae bacterium]|nr:endonuclease MutS2 [Erysipelotrichaceae bacterium]
MENYKGLQFEEVKQLIAAKSSFSLGHKLIEEMEPSFSTLAVRNNLETIKQALDMTVSYGPMPFGGIYDISPLVILAKKDGTLTPNELLQVADQSYGIEEIIRYTKNATCEKKRIADLVSSLNSYQSTARTIVGCIDRSGQVLDSASVKLKSIRSSIKSTQGKIASVMNRFISANSQYLQDTIIATRNDRNVVLVKNTYKNAVKGLQYGTSASGMASYVEPAECVELNNNLSELMDDERREIQRILHELSQHIKRDADGYLA